MWASSHAAARPIDAPTAAGLFVLTLGALDFGLEQSIIVAALPRLATDYHASLIAIGWLATAFLLAAIVAVPLVGRLGDLFGKRRMLLVSLNAFTLGSLVCALAHSVPLAIAGRAIQGAGAAVVPLTLGLARDIIPPHSLSRAIGVVVGAANVGVGVGFLVGALLVDKFSPAALFWFLFAFSALLTVGVFGYVAESPMRTRVPVDIAGAALLGTSLAALLLAISKGEAWGWPSGAILGLFAAAAVGLAGFALVERRAHRPLLDLAFVTRRPFVIANLCALTYGFAFFQFVFLIPQIAAAPTASVYGLGLSTTQVGLLLLPPSVAGFVAGWLAGRKVDRVGPSVIVISAAVLGAGGYALLAVSHNSLAALVVGGAAIGVGWGAIPASFYRVVLGHADADKSAVSASVTRVFQNIGAAVGVTVVLVILSNSGFTGPFRTDNAFVRAFALGAASAGLVVVAGLLLLAAGARPAANGTVHHARSNPQEG
jgi:MFS family permease